MLRGMISQRLQGYFEDYASYHRTSGNQWTHYLGIPLIALGLLGLLSGIELGLSIPGTLFRLDGGVVLLGLGGLFYLWLDWKVAIPFLLILAATYFLSRVFPAQWLWGFFVFGWVLQGVGHYYFEKRSPAFFKNFTHLLVGPLWIFAKILGLNGRSRASGSPKK